MTTGASTRHIHIDPCGGIAGDMMMAALVDAFPEQRTPLETLFKDSALAGVACLSIAEEADHNIRGLHAQVRSANSEHHHRTFADIREILTEFTPSVRERALDIFHRIALAEAHIHGKSVDEVHFHEVGAWDSIADIVGVSFLLDQIGATSWSSGPLKPGNGTVKAAHGNLPVPAPATLEILSDCLIETGGPPWERITPTGAAIVAHLEPEFHQPAIGRLLRAGTGLGKKRGLPFLNALRLMVMETPLGHVPSIGEDDQVGTITCEIDDQTPEDLAIAIDHLRSAPGVLDVTQNQITGKKGRVAVQLQILTRPDALEEVILLCFQETTSLGLRYGIQNRRILHRQELTMENKLGPVRVKQAMRPVGLSRKVEADDLSSVQGQVRRQVLRTEVEFNDVDNISNNSVDEVKK